MSTRVPTYFPQISPYLLNIPLYFPKIQLFVPKIPLYLPKIPLFLPKIPLRCCQEENQTKESKNLTFIRPHFYQKSNQNWSWPLYFSGQNLNCSKNIIKTLGTVTFICKKNLDLKGNLDIFFYLPKLPLYLPKIPLNFPQNTSVFAQNTTISSPNTSYLHKIPPYFPKTLLYFPNISQWSKIVLYGP